MNEDDLNDDNVAALHIDVDRMERVMRSSSGTHQESPFQKDGSPASVGASRDHEDDAFWGPLSPSRNVNMRLPVSPLRSHSSLQKALDMSPSKATLLAQEAESLLDTLSRTVKELQARKEETNVSLQLTSTPLFTTDTKGSTSMTSLSPVQKQPRNESSS
jgi:hypothetical protein